METITHETFSAFLTLRRGLNRAAFCRRANIPVSRLDKLMDGEVPDDATVGVMELLGYGWQQSKVPSVPTPEEVKEFFADRGKLIQVIGFAEDLEVSEFMVRQIRKTGVVSRILWDARWEVFYRYGFTQKTEQ
jgi:hypothetical protein